MGKQKFYVVWIGFNPGIYHSWTDCLLQTKGVKGAKYKSFGTLKEAQEAFSLGYTAFMPQYIKTKENKSTYIEELPDMINAIAVDASCSGNPGKMEYRGLYIANMQEIFHFGPKYGTNNIGEFLAIVHALALIKQRKWNEMDIYSDSRIAIKWVSIKKCKTKLERNKKSEELFQLIERAERWLANNNYSTKIKKWETSKWGEIPADFGRK